MKEKNFIGPTSDTDMAIRRGDLVMMHDEPKNYGCGIVMADKVADPHSPSLFPYVRVYFFKKGKMLDMYVGAIKLISPVPKSS